VSGSFRRRVAGILALAVGFGVIISSAPASANPVHRSLLTTVAPASAHTGPVVVTHPSDWWW
jgi:hypothetical protein